MKITHEHMWEDIDLYHLNDKTRQCMEYICDRSYPSIDEGLSDDKYNAYMYAQYLESAMQMLERSDALPGPFRYGEPLYNRDDRSFYLRGFKCGCSSLEQLSLWFPTSIVGELITYGFKLVKYTLSDVLPGNTQVCWLPSMVVSKDPTGYNVEDLKRISTI